MTSGAIPVKKSETVPNVLRYAGVYWDRETGLSKYLRARWYDPSVGRFITEDTFEGEATNPLSLHLYTYVENNPLKYVDPSGKGKKPANNVLLGLDNGSGSASAGRMTPGGSMGGDEAEAEVDHRVVASLPHRIMGSLLRGRVILINRLNLYGDQQRRWLIYGVRGN